MDGDSLLQESLQLVRQVVPGSDPKPEVSGGSTSFALPFASGAECRFSVSVYLDGEPQIAAEPRTRSASYFWVYHFELPDFESSRQRSTKFLAELRRLLASPTRIVEEEGLLWLSYSCFLERAGAWSVFGSRNSLLAPRLVPRRREYLSPAIAPTRRGPEPPGRSPTSAR